MTPVQLLEPRFKVIANYPHSQVTVGEVIYGSTPYLDELYSSFPHLFKKFKWWELRKIDDMPKYVFYKEEKSVHIVDRWLAYTLAEKILFLPSISLDELECEVYGAYLHDQPNRIHPSHLTPITEEAYNHYKQKQQ